MDIFVEILELEKINVVGVGYDGKQAVELCKKYNPNFLILDLSMPNFDGFYALEELQDKIQTKIIVLTGVIDSQILEKLEKFSIFSIQRKPVDTDVIVNILKAPK